MENLSDKPAMSSLAQNREQLEKEKAVLTARVQAKQEQFSQNADQGRTEVESRWQHLRSDVDAHFASLKAKADEHRAHADRKRAERRADSAELDALMAVDFAILAVEQAEFAVVVANDARTAADSLTNG